MQWNSKRSQIKRKSRRVKETRTWPMAKQGTPIQLPHSPVVEAAPAILISYPATPMDIFLLSMASMSTLLLPLPSFMPPESQAMPRLPDLSCISSRTTSFSISKSTRLPLPFPRVFLMHLPKECLSDFLGGRVCPGLLRVEKEINLLRLGRIL